MERRERWGKGKLRVTKSEGERGSRDQERKEKKENTVCPRSSDPFLKVSYCNYIKWVTETRDEEKTKRGE